jgi:hypothetical protein
MSQNAIYLSHSVSLDAMAGQTILVIFTWKNDGDGVGEGPPASVDGVSLKYCIKSIDYDVTGGGSYCAGSTGVHVGLAGSVAGINYQLNVNGDPAGPVILGTGSPIDFGLQTVPGTYNVVGTSGECTYSLSGHVEVTENSSEAANAGILTSASICSGESGSIALSGNSMDPVRWEYSTDSTSASWNVIENTTTAQSFTNITVPTFYRAVVNNGCGDVNSPVGTVAIHNYWTGSDGTDPTDWNRAANWSDGQVPSSASCDDVIIPVSTHNPVLGTGPVAVITNLYISTGATLTVNGSGHMKIAGDIHNLGNFDVTGGTLEMNGTTGSQDISGSMFKNNVPGMDHTVHNLILSNDVDVAGTLNDTLNISGTLSFGNAFADLHTGNNVTLKSAAAATASVGIQAAGNTITGNVMVERFINSGTGHPRSWQFVAANTVGQTIFNAWMEGGTVPVGYGTWITDASGTAGGFDGSSASPSMKYYDDLANTWIAVTNPKVTGIINQMGYMLFVRGDRNANAANSVATPTVLRSKGTLYQPSLPPSAVTVSHGKYQSVGNPYASAIQIDKIGFTNINKDVAVWDPTLSGSYGVGGYQTLSATNGYEPTAGSPASALYTAGVAYPYIQSGQAFFVKSDAATDGSVTFSESAKVSNSRLVFRGSGEDPNKQFMRASLYTGSGLIADGNAVAFSSAYSDQVDGNDARKIGNGGENFGLLRDGIWLAVEGRSPVRETDTLFYKLTNLRQQGYQLRFAPKNMAGAGLDAELVDNYLKSRTPVSLDMDTTYIDFAITGDAASQDPGRFMMVFRAMKTEGPLPVTFVSVKAYQKDRDIAVEWDVENETKIKQYEIEKSTDGIHFSVITAISPKANNGGRASYEITDKNPVEGYNHYRIRSADMDGKTAYTQVVKVWITNLKMDIAIYPNPITDGIIHLQLVNQPKGNYVIRFYNKLGQLIVQKLINHPEGSSTELIPWDYNLAHGMYQLMVTRPDGSVKNLNVLY